MLHYHVYSTEVPGDTSFVCECIVPSRYPGLAVKQSWIDLYVKNRAVSIHLLSFPVHNTMLCHTFPNNE